MLDPILKHIGNILKLDCSECSTLKLYISACPKTNSKRLTVKHCWGLVLGAGVKVFWSAFENMQQTTFSGQKILAGKGLRMVF